VSRKFSGANIMNEKKEKLVNLIVEHNVSAIVTISENLKIQPEDVVKLINELISEDKLHGMITEDGTRFYRSDAKVSEAPVIPREDEMPDFLSYDTRPGIAIAIVGAIILVAGGVVSNFATDVPEADFAAMLFLLGLSILFGGLYLVAKRKTPD